MGLLLLLSEEKAGMRSGLKTVLDAANFNPASP
jgi:hypothetical protein